jgi:hypothetical protein
MISDRSLIALRSGAAVAHAVPGVRLRVEGGGRLLIEVAHHVEPANTDVHRTMTPCAFRMAVAGARRHRQEGRRLQFIGLDADLDPSVSFGVRPSSDVVLPGGMLRVRYHERWLHLLPLDGATEAIEAIDDLVAEPYEGNGYEVGIAVHHDPELGIGLLHVTTDIYDDERSAAAIDALVTAAARHAIEEFEAHLAPLTREPATEVATAPDRADRDPRRR